MKDLWNLSLLIIVTNIVFSQQSVSGNMITDLLEVKHSWKSVYAKISQNNSQLDITVNALNTNRTYNRAYLDTIIKSESLHNSLSVVYSTNTTGNTTFVVEIIHKPMKSDVTKSISNTENKTEISWIKNLGLTLGFITKRTYEIPDELINKAIQIRFYLITSGPGESTFNITRAVISDS